MSFFASRWRGEAPLDRLFWRDMVLVGTILNLVTTAAAILLLGLKAPMAVVLAVHFSPVPYNIFLFAAVWRTADAAGNARAAFFRSAALLWLVAATVI
ncbi:hypothetical protein [Allomesorhizobium alhagi]|jgi:hypothetical protein|uniref:Uncharacterized protein n=1 Tax=Mesorhizobium alhagi CCNWXJ12-2 TaxID=1107882 RepID=H0HM09_9HYPH|nr:hypothetical protein [Mesorhizobium alhagi]EHK58201.1 hypothetical protein MAXJ12_05863 [Mesorhizobium alhagi CCNWXJ12-2]